VSDRLRDGPSVAGTHDGWLLGPMRRPKPGGDRWPLMVGLWWLRFRRLGLHRIQQPSGTRMRPRQVNRPGFPEALNRPVVSGGSERSTVSDTGYCPAVECDQFATRNCRTERMITLTQTANAMMRTAKLAISPPTFCRCCAGPRTRHNAGFASGSASQLALKFFIPNWGKMGRKFAGIRGDSGNRADGGTP
jgi:hypothetical protein